MPRWSVPSTLLHHWKAPCSSLTGIWPTHTGEWPSWLAKATDCKISSVTQYIQIFLLAQWTSLTFRFPITPCSSRVNLVSWLHVHSPFASVVCGLTSRSLCSALTSFTLCFFQFAYNLNSLSLKFKVKWNFPICESPATAQMTNPAFISCQDRVENTLWSSLFIPFSFNCDSCSCPKSLRIYGTTQSYSESLQVWSPCS